MSIEREKRKALAKSGNLCAFPGCCFELIKGGEVAHIRSSKKRGPRHEPNWNDGNFDVEENFICLCPTHHTWIDTNVEEFPIEKLEEMKREHELRVSRAMKDAQSEDEKFLMKVFRFLQHYEMIECIEKYDSTVPTNANYLEKMDGFQIELEHLISNARVSKASRNLITDWEKFANFLGDYLRFLIPYINYNNGVYVNNNPNESRSQIMYYRNSLMSILTKYLNS